MGEPTCGLLAEERRKAYIEVGKKIREKSFPNNR
jgi:hypothetical protein